MARARCRRVVRPTSPKAGPTAATGATAATCGSWPTATWPRCWPSPITRTGGPWGASTGRATSATARAGPTSMVAVPEGTVVMDRDRTVLADMVHAGDRFRAAAGGQGGRGNARFLSNRRRAPSFAEQGERGEERWLRLGAEAHGRRGAGRVAERRQEHADLTHLGGQAEDRRLPLHHARAPSRCGARRGAASSTWWPTSRD